MAETASRSRPAQSVRESDRGEQGLAPLRVSYYRRMKPNQVYPWVVTWKRGKDDKKGPDQDVTLRLLVAGAQVVPSEQTINASDGTAKATFYVTAIAKGWLKGQRLEVLLGGRKVQEIPLASKAVSQRSTLVLLFLTFFLPWFILSYFKYPPLGTRDDFRNGQLVVKRNNDPLGLAMADHIKSNIPPTSEIVEEYLGKEVANEFDAIPRYMGGLYEEISIECKERPIAFYVGCIFLLLTVISACLHRQKSKTAVGRPIPLPASGSNRPNED